MFGGDGWKEQAACNLVVAFFVCLFPNMLRRLATQSYLFPLKGGAVTRSYAGFFAGFCLSDASSPEAFIAFTGI